MDLLLQVYLTTRAIYNRNTQNVKVGTTSLISLTLLSCFSFICFICIGHTCRGEPAKVPCISILLLCSILLVYSMSSALNKGYDHYVTFNVVQYLGPTLDMAKVMGLDVCHRLSIYIFLLIRFQRCLSNIEN